MHHKFYRRRSK